MTRLVMYALLRCSLILATFPAAMVLEHYGFEMTGPRVAVWLAFCCAAGVIGGLLHARHDERKRWREYEEMSRRLDDERDRAMFGEVLP